MNITLKAVVVMKIKIKAETGLTISKGRDFSQIGEVDLPVIKDPDGYPFIPGSSLKGKFRSTYEKLKGKVKDEFNSPSKMPYHICKDPKCPICSLYGRTSDANEKVISEGKGTPIPTMLYFKDFSIDNPERKEPGKFLEVKPENSVDRITSKANPRFIERVMKGTVFKGEIVLNLYEPSQSANTLALKEQIEAFEEGFVKIISIVETLGIGGHVSRGYGKISLDLEDALVYINRSAEDKLNINPEPIEAKDFTELVNELKKKLEIN